MSCCRAPVDTFKIPAYIDFDTGSLICLDRWILGRIVVEEVLHATLVVYAVPFDGVKGLTRFRHGEMAL